MVRKVWHVRDVWYATCLLWFIRKHAPMKAKFYILVIATLISISLSATPRTLITAIVNNGNWSSAATWSPARVPQNNDSIVIPAGLTVYFDNSYTLNNVYLLIAGTLNFNQNNTLALDINSVVNIPAGGTLTATHPTPNELISINGVTKFNGKTDGTISGPASATSMTGSDPAGFTQVTLPVTFVSFSANRGERTVELVWNTVNENNNSHFEIERSANGSDWQTIGDVAAGTNSLSNSYSFTDESAPAAQTEYRIRQVDLDGNYAYSKVVLIGGSKTATAQVTIFATGKTVSIVTGNMNSSKLIVRVISIGGQVLRQQSFAGNGGRIDMAVNTNTTGVYFVQVTDGNQLSIVKEVML